MVKKDFIKLFILQFLCGLALEPVGLLASVRPKSRQVSKQSVGKPKAVGTVSSSRESEEGEILEGSLFLRARKPYRIIRGNKTEYDFLVGNGSYERGKFVYVANPTYDLTFKSLFLGMDGVDEEDLASPENANKRLISLLNSLVYPEADNDTNKEHIIAIEIEESSIRISAVHKHTKTNSDHENALKELRCDIVCKCKLGSNVTDLTEDKVCILYFDLEMQRKNIKNRINEFLTYQQSLQDRYRQTVKIIAFLDYETDEAIESTRIAREVMDKDCCPVPASDQANVPFQPMIGLKRVVEDILNEKDIVVTDGKIIGITGKEWLKLLGIRWWARQNKKYKEYYAVPSNVQSKSIGEALNILKKGKINDREFQVDVERIFNAKKTIDELETSKKQEGLEEGEMIGILKGLMRGFVKGREIDDDEIEGIGQNSLDGSFVKEIWSTLPNIPDSKNVDDFIGILRKKGLVKK